MPRCQSQLHRITVSTYVELSRRGSAFRWVSLELCSSGGALVAQGRLRHPGHGQLLLASPKKKYGCHVELPRVAQPWKEMSSQAQILVPVEVSWSLSLIPVGPSTGPLHQRQRCGVKSPNTRPGWVVWRCRDRRCFHLDGAGKPEMLRHSSISN